MSSKDDEYDYLFKGKILVQFYINFQNNGIIDMSAIKRSNNNHRWVLKITEYVRSMNKYLD